MKSAIFLLLLGLVVSTLSADTPPRGCSILTISQDAMVFFAGNDDYHNRDSTYWVDPGSGSDYGVVYFGAPGNVQQGFNEAGLAYDANSVPLQSVRSHDGSLPGPSTYSLYPSRILAECATVPEVITWVETHTWHSAMHDQLHFADASGDGVVIGVGADGKVAFTTKPPGDSYLVSTNFNVANPAGGTSAWRYGRATRSAQQLLDERSLSADTVADIMESVHIENRDSFTLYTVVGDLAGRTIDVYFMFQYDDPITIDIRSAIAGGSTRVALSSLFPPAVVEAAGVEYKRLATTATRFVVAAIIWAAAVVVCVGLWLLDRRMRSLGATSLVAVVILGPIGLLLSVYQSRTTSDSATAPGLSAAATVIVLAIVVLPALEAPQLSGSPLTAIAMLTIAPVLVALLAARAPWLATSQQISYGTALLRSAAPTFFSTAFLLTLLLPLVLPLSLWVLERTRSFLVSGALVWAGGAIGSVIAIVILWAARRVFARNEQDRLRWFLSTLLVIGALVLLYAGIALSQQTLDWLRPVIAGGPASMY